VETEPAGRVPARLAQRLDDRLLFFLLGFIVYVFAVTPQQGFEAFRHVLLVQIGTIILVCVLIATYLVHLFRNDRLPSDRRILWAVVLLLFGIFAFPVYWWLYVRPGAGDATYVQT